MKKPSRIIYYDDHAEIELHSKGKYYYCKIDLENAETFKNYRWCYSIDGYAYTQFRNKKNIYNVKLHRILMKDQLTKEKPFVDHINRDRLDCRKSNLKICSRTENNHNITRQKNNTSGCTGVSWFKLMNKWRSRIYVNGQDITLGYFDNVEDAAKARLEAEKRYFGKTVANESMSENLKNII